MVNGVHGAHLVNVHQLVEVEVNFELEFVTILLPRMVDESVLVVMSKLYLASYSVVQVHTCSTSLLQTTFTIRAFSLRNRFSYHLGNHYVW